MRIVGGKFRGRKLAEPKSDRIRPTTDRTRESLFNILGHRMDFERLRVLDMFAGTGALGLEAMSRGAGFCLFMDQSAEARALIRTNIEAFGLQGATKIFRRDATTPGPAGNLGKFGLVFLDPPYGKTLGERALAALRSNDWLEKEAVVVLEEHKNALPVAFEGYLEIDRRQFGETAILILEVSS